MKPYFVGLFLTMCCILTSCMPRGYQSTTFYVTNTSDKTVHFKASVLKHSTMGSFVMTLPFTVPPKDSVLARKTLLRVGASPTVWFEDFTIFPVDSVLLNNPRDSTAWVKSFDAKGKPVYTFNVQKK